MADCRAFTVGPDGHFVGFEPIVCDTGDQAVERAKRLLDGRALEVWCAERLIAKLKLLSSSRNTLSGAQVFRSEQTLDRI